MTTVLAWVRELKKTKELIFVSDSRLTCGENIDICQKIFSLPRGDCAIAFCGSTHIAYPFIMQIISIIKSHPKMKNRAMDFSKIASIVSNILNQFVESYEETLKGVFVDDLRDTSFLIGGWSAINQKFILKRISYDNGAKTYVVSKTGVGQALGLPKNDSVSIAFVGDYIPDILKEFRSLILENPKLSKTGFDYEPIKVLNSMLKDTDYTDRKKPKKGKIGGAPQLLKIYPYMQSTSFQMANFEKNSNQRFLEGRPLFKFEKPDNPIFDLKTFTTKK